MFERIDSREKLPGDDETANGHAHFPLTTSARLEKLNTAASLSQPTHQGGNP
jgi:hypothetical protein